MSAHMYWMSVVAAMKAEPQCEIRDSVLRDMNMHEPVKNGDVNQMICVDCSMWGDDAIAVAPCRWITDWGKRLEVTVGED